ncbi:hypothetical protein [Glaciibacter psychrotolerans]|uniref:Uncharacterized protein n=1 Tax=Glaciibacter psychrotolerans TaxID=670054 RepID=A0A7Z0J7B0_9MICO|nr:hypothetical protein [Leifsonia psychrotolerans]NYJ21096.1 hypothetical protein [Leifsonia psychrotolerans]
MIDQTPATPIPTRRATQQRRLGAGIIVVGVLLGAWITFGRFLFGVGGSLTAVYALIGLTVVVLYLFIGLALRRTARNDHPTRPTVFGTLGASVGCGILLGLMIPDATPDGLQTILTGGEEPGLGIVVGVANPLGIILIALAIVSLWIANLDARGVRANPEDFD